MDIRAASERRNALLMRRLDELVPNLMAETGIECWILMGREYAEDPVLMTMLPSEWLSARRRTILILTSEVRLAVSRYPVGDFFASAWNSDQEPDQWTRLVEILTELNPRTIGIGMSYVQAHADGLSATEHQALMESLPQGLAERVVPAGLLGVRWLETRLPEERPTLATATHEAHTILRRGLSTEAITPGVTTTKDLVWWYRQTVADAGLGSWFQPSVTIQRRGEETDSTIVTGDLIHVDFGIMYESMCTDQQEHAYVLDRGEASAPPGLSRGIDRANQVQDILIEEFVTGRTGNEILASALDKSAARELEATIYTHSIGLHGHGAGMTIGLWDQQHGVAGAGDHPLHPNTAYSIELMARSDVPEWGGKAASFMLEQDAWFDGRTCDWLDGRQDELWLI